MLKRYWWSIVIVLALVLSACGGSSTSTESSAAPAASSAAPAASSAAPAAAGKACVILPDSQSSDRWENQDRPAIQSALEAAGFSYPTHRHPWDEGIFYARKRGYGA